MKNNSKYLRDSDYSLVYANKRSCQLLSSLRERDHLGDPGVDGRIILRWIFSKMDMVVWTGSKWLRIGTGVGQL
jgi:hypothetical protein